MACDVLERAWKLPSGWVRPLEGLGDRLADDLEVSRSMRLESFLGVTFGDLDQRFAEGLHLDKCHVVDEADEESFSGKALFSLATISLDMTPTAIEWVQRSFGGEVRRNASAAGSHGRGDDDIFHGVETQNFKRGLIEPIWPGSRKRGLTTLRMRATRAGSLEMVIEILGGGAGVFDQFDDFKGDFREGGDVGDGVDRFCDNRLRIFFDRRCCGRAAGGWGCGGGGGGWTPKRLLVNRSPATAQKVHRDYRWFGWSSKEVPFLWDAIFSSGGGRSGVPVGLSDQVASRALSGTGSLLRVRSLALWILQSSLGISSQLSCQPERNGPSFR